MTFDVELIRDETRLRAIEPQWWELWRTSPAATPFQSPGWAIPWWRHFHPGPLVCVAVHAGERLVGLAPFYFEEGFRGERLLPVGIGVSDHLDILVDPRFPGVGEAIVAALEAEPRWTILALEELAEGAVALSLPARSGWDDSLSPQIACPGLSLSGEVDDDGLPMDIPKRRRQHFRRSLKVAKAAGGCRIDEVSAETFLPELIRLHAARWQAKGEDGVMTDPRVQAFHRDSMPLLQKTGLVRFFFVTITGELAAAYYGFRWADRAGFYVSGFDPKFSRESPLGILIGHALRDAAASGAKDFSFLRGQEEYKYLWGATDRWNMRRTLTRPAP